MGVHHFDCIVLGGGSGGIAFARRAAIYGIRVALVESRRMGGTCVNAGCVPKKVMWYAANALESLHGLHHLGIDVKDCHPRFDWEKLVENRDKYIRRLNQIYESNLEKSKVHRFYGWARLTPRETNQEEHLVLVGNSKDGESTVDDANTNTCTDRLMAKHVLIATGGELSADSEGFFKLKRQPRRAAVLGAGYIAVELSGILQALGTETHLFTRFERALRKFDSLIQDQNHINMTQLGIQVHPNSIASRITGEAGCIHLELENGEKHGPFDCLINAIGRQPETDKIGLESIGVDVTKEGYIKTDEYQNTNINGVFALGDCCGKVELTPMAIAAGRRLADRLYGNVKEAKAEYDNVPSVIFSHPPIGSVGLSEEEAKNMYGEGDIKIYQGTCVNLMYGAYQIPPEDKPKTVIKLICRKSEGGRILGLHIVGMGADEILQGFAVAIKMGATKADFDRCVAIHPTAAEEVVTLPPWGLYDF